MGLVKMAYDQVAKITQGNEKRARGTGLLPPQTHASAQKCESARVHLVLVTELNEALFGVIFYQGYYVNMSIKVRRCKSVALHAQPAPTQTAT